MMGLGKNLLAARLKQAGQVGVTALAVTVLLDVINAVLHTGLAAAWRLNTIGFAIGFVGVGAVVYFILLSQGIERIWTRNQYRLLPLSTLRLYLVNLGTALIAWLAYHVGCGLVLVAASYALGVPPKLPHASFGEIAAVGALILVLEVFVWGFITLVHLLAETLRWFLPEKQAGWLTAGLYLVVIIGVLLATNLLIRVAGLPFDGTLFGAAMPLTTDWTVWVGSGIYLVMIVLMAALSMALLDHTVETKA